MKKIVECSLKNLARTRLFSRVLHCIVSTESGQKDKCSEVPNGEFQNKYFAKFMERACFLNVAINDIKNNFYIF